MALIDTLLKNTKAEINKANNVLQSKSLEHPANAQKAVVALEDMVKEIKGNLADMTLDLKKGLEDGSRTGAEFSKFAKQVKEMQKQRQSLEARATRLKRELPDIKKAYNLSQQLPDVPTGKKASGVKLDPVADKTLKSVKELEAISKSIKEMKTDNVTSAKIELLGKYIKAANAQSSKGNMKNPAMKGALGEARRHAGIKLDKMLGNMAKNPATPLKLLTQLKGAASNLTSVHAAKVDKVKNKLRTQRARMASASSKGKFAKTNVQQLKSGRKFTR